MRQPMNPGGSNVARNPNMQNASTINNRSAMAYLIVGDIVIALARSLTPKLSCPPEVSGQIARIINVAKAIRQTDRIADASTVLS
jgi:hypothetical protein